VSRETCAQCGRPMIEFPGELEATCAECRNRPDSCTCDPLPDTTAADTSINGISPQAPQLTDVSLPDEAALTDSELTRRAIRGALAGRFLFVKGLGWMAWNGNRWTGDAEAEARHAVDLYLRNVLASGINSGADPKALLGILSKAKVKAVTEMAADNPAIRRDASDFDADPDLLNTPSGIVNLRTGEQVEHDPKYLMTKITKGSYRPGYTHPDWTKALEALPPDERTWYQTRIGQAITGHRTPDGVMPVLQGGGENGKTLLTTDGLVPALGDYADVASPKLIATDRPGRSEHSTERADLRGQRLLVGEELSEGRSLDITALKRIMDVSHIKARRVHQDNISFETSHSLFVTTNYVPVVTETDHGTWRRLVLLKFPYSFRKSADECVRPTDRVGDPTIKRRIKEGREGQLDAIVTWAVEGAQRWYADPDRALMPTGKIADDTLKWRITADRILGFWTERLVADGGTNGVPAPCILAQEMTDAFNAWLKGNGHEAWSRETFAPRFAEHQETTRHGVESRRTAALGNVSRRPVDDAFETQKPAPKQATVWTRVRFRTDDDQRESPELAEVAEVVPNISLPIRGEEFGSNYATSATLPSGSPADGPEPAVIGTTAAAQPDIRSVAGSPVASVCSVCGTPMSPRLASAGLTVHPNCDSSAGSSSVAVA
jgi:putative DNA primase/helicase